MAEYLVVLTFDADTKQHKPDYDCADKRLAAIGLNRFLQGKQKQAELPHNTYAGMILGEDSSVVADNIANRAAAELPKCDIVGRVFVIAADSYTWVTRSIGNP